MNRLIEEFDAVYPGYQSFCSVDWTFDEDENLEKPNTFKHLIINGINASFIPKKIIKNITSFYTSANSKEVLRKDPDGIFLIEDDGKKYIYIVEMKSNYTKSNIIKAKDQVVGTYLKLHSLFSLLQSYNPSEWIVRGIIASFSPSVEAVQNFMKTETDDANRFFNKFQRDKKYIMPEHKCKNYFSPLNVPEITLYYVAVPAKTDSYTVNFRDIIT